MPAGVRNWLPDRRLCRECAAPPAPIPANTPAGRPPAKPERPASSPGSDATLTVDRRQGDERPAEHRQRAGLGTGTGASQMFAPQVKPDAWVSADAA